MPSCVHSRCGLQRNNSQVWPTREQTETEYTIANACTPGASLWGPVLRQQASRARVRMSCSRVLSAVGDLPPVRPPRVLLPRRGGFTTTVVVSEAGNDACVSKATDGEPRRSRGSVSSAIFSAVNAMKMTGSLPWCSERSKWCKKNHCTRI